MKKFSMSVLLESVLLMLLCVCALADTPIGTTMEVAYCNEFVSLRAEPDTNAELLARVPLDARVVCLEDMGKFCLVGTEYGRGYILSKYLRVLYDGREGLTPSFIPHADINLFLSNFTEADFAWDKGYFTLGDDAEMVEFAVNHIWFNQQDKLTWYNDIENYNVSVDASYIPSIVERFFNVEPIGIEAKWRDYDGKKYTWTETGGHTKGNFAMLTAMTDLGNGYYNIWFETYGGGYKWDNSVFDLSLEDARKLYPYSHGNGCAMIHADNLFDKDTYYLVRYAINR